MPYPGTFPCQLWSLALIAQSAINQHKSVSALVNPICLSGKHMPHSVTLITTIAVSFGLALLMGLIANRLKLPVLVGYLVAGVILGSNTPGFVADMELSAQLAEIGPGGGDPVAQGAMLHFDLGDSTHPIAGHDFQQQGRVQPV